MQEKNNNDIERQITEEAEAQLRLTAATYMTVLTGDWVCAIICDKMEAFVRSPLYVRKAKKLANILIKKREAYERMMNNIVEKQAVFYADMCQYFEDGLREDLFKLENAVMFEFSKKKAKYPDVLAKVELCRSMAKVSCRINDRVNDEARRLGKMTTLKYMRQTEIAKVATSLSDLITHDYKKVINLNENQMVISGVMAIINKIIKSDLVQRSYLSTEE